jgi:hypothetical protein
MAKVLTSIALDDPSSPLSIGQGQTFAFSGTPGFTGGGGVQRYDFKWEVDSGGGFVTIGTGTGLDTSGTNPLVNTNSQTQNALTVDCADVGSYTVRIVGAPTSGGSYTVLSSTQTVEVTASSVEATPGTASLTLTTFAPTVSVSDNKKAVPGVASLTLTAFAPTVTASDHKVVTPGTAVLTLTAFAPTVGIGVRAVPGTLALTLTTFAPSVSATQNQLAIPGTASLVLTTFAPTVGSGVTVVPGTAQLTLTTFAPTVTAGRKIYWWVRVG